MRTKTIRVSQKKSCAKILLSLYSIAFAGTNALDSIAFAVLLPPTCNGLTATVYVDETNHIVGGPNNGAVYTGTLTGNSGGPNSNDVMVGTEGNDIINGLNGSDTICGLGGNDTIDGGNGSDALFGGNGNDRLFGNNGNDSLDCGTGIDFGDPGNGPQQSCEAGAGQGIVIIEKDAIANSAQDFSFTGGLGAFSLDDDTDPTLPSSRNFAMTASAGGINYAITEGVTAGWSLTGLVCTGDVSDAGTTVNLGTRTATVHLNINDIVTCTFTNTQSVVCGDGLITGSETCDDSNTTNGDGCASTCQVESGYACTGTPSVCTTVCGNGIRTGSETCDDGNTTNNDGCSAVCATESGYSCTLATPNVCTTTCGDGATAGTEQCDDGNTENGDGCTNVCQREITDLSIQKTGPLVTVRGGQAAYSLVASNNGGLTATNVIVTDVLPSHLQVAHQLPYHQHESIAQSLARVRAAL